MKLLDTVAEKLSAIRHANGVDYWIVVHKYYSDAFYAYQLSPAGIINVVISHIGSRHPNVLLPQITSAAIGSMKFSPDGSKLAIVSSNSGSYAVAEYLDFDKSTGILSNCINLQTNPGYNYYGISFSPDNSKLYITCCLNNNGLFQFDLNSGNGDPDSVRASRTKIAGANWSWGLQLAIDGKIYVAGQGRYISVVNSPNSPGLSCNFSDSSIYLVNGSCSMGLPNFIDSYDYSNGTNDCNVGIKENEGPGTVSISPNPTSGIIALKSSSAHNSVSIYNSLSELIYMRNNFPALNDIDLSAQEAGIYFCEVRNERGQKIFKIVKSE